MKKIWKFKSKPYRKCIMIFFSKKKLCSIHGNLQQMFENCDLNINNVFSKKM